MGPQQQCGVCQGAAARYKCPACILPYCSIACFKSHKANPCAKPEPQQQQQQAEAAAQPPRDFERDEDDSQVRDMLKDAELRRSIKSIDASENAAGDLDSAMESPAFKAFADKLLEIINA